MVSIMPLDLKVFPLDGSPGFLIYKTAVKMKASLSRAFQTGGFDITPEQWAVLSRLWEHEGLHQSALAESVSKDRHNVTRILHLLEAAGLVTRKGDARDKRCRKVYLTEKGRFLKTDLVDVVKIHNEKALNGLTQSDLEELFRLHKIIIGNLRSDERTESDPCESDDCGDSQ